MAGLLGTTATGDVFNLYVFLEIASITAYTVFAAIYGQVIKTRRNNRVIRVRRELRIGTSRQLAAPSTAWTTSATTGLGPPSA